MAIAGIGSGALVGALPSAAAAAAPRGQTGIATGAHQHDEDDRRLVRVGDLRDRARRGRRRRPSTATASSLLGYMTVFTICGVGALVAAVLLFLVPKLAFADVEDDLVLEVPVAAGLGTRQSSD